MISALKAVTRGDITPLIMALIFVVKPSINSLLFLEMWIEYGWYKVRLYIWAAKWHPISKETLVLSHISKILIIPENRANTQNITAKKSSLLSIEKKLSNSSKNLNMRLSLDWIWGLSNIPKKG